MFKVEMLLANKCTGWGSISTFQHQNWKKQTNSTTDASINFPRTTPPPTKKKVPQKRKNLKNWQQNLKFISKQGLILFPLILIMEWTLKTPCKGDDNSKIISFFKNIQKHQCYFNFMSS